MATLEELEGEVWPAPAPHEATRLIRTCHALRKKDTALFTSEDLRILVGQTIGIKHLLPQVLTVLEREPFAEGDFYPGDLMTALVRPANWPALEESSERIEALCKRVLGRIADVGDDGVEARPGYIIFPDLARSIREDLEAYLYRKPRH